jgi:hypothetical protein
MSRQMITTLYGCYPPGREPKGPWIPDEQTNPWTKKDDDIFNKEIKEILDELKEENEALKEEIEKLKRKLRRNKKPKSKKNN